MEKIAKERGIDISELEIKDHSSDSTKEEQPLERASAVDTFPPQVKNTAVSK